MLERSSESIGLTSLAAPYADIEIWHIDLEMAQTQRERVEQYLSDDEQERARLFSWAKSRQQFVLVRGLLREVLAARINASAVGTVTASSLQFGYGRFGKPYLVAHREWQFNVAHTRNSALIVVARNRAVGVDIQWCNPNFDTQKVVEMAFADRERQLLLDKECEFQHAIFFQIWALKEAYAKADGSGLSIKLRNVDTSAALEAPIFPLIWDENKAEWRSEFRFELHSLNFPDCINQDCKAAMAIEY